jgi:hypothetical protein
MTDETDQSINGDGRGENSDAELSQVKADYPKPIPDSDRFAGPLPGKTTFTGSVPDLSQIPAGDRVVEIWESKTKLVAAVPCSSDGRWAATLDTVDGKPFYAAKLVKGSAYFDFSSLIYTAPLKTLTINPPKTDWVGAYPTITGSNGYPLATVKLYRVGDETTVYGIGGVSLLGTWSFRVTNTLPANIEDLTCQQTFNGVSSPRANAVRFKFLSTPVVTAANDVIDLDSAISGTANGGTSFTIIGLYRDLSDEIVGTGMYVSSGGWVGKLNGLVKPGQITVTAQQNHNGWLTDRSAPVTFRIRPEPPVVTAVVYYGTTTAFKGRGFPGATIDIHPSSGSPNATALVNPQGYFETTPITLNPGTTGATWGARQKIANGSAWIFSAYHPIPPVFNVPTPVPTVNAPTLIGQIPTVTGRGSIWQGLAAAKIEVVLKGATEIKLEQATVTATGDWTATTTTAVPPGSYTVSVRQLMNGVYSLPITAPASLDIKPLPPTVDVWR